MSMTTTSSNGSSPDTGDTRRPGAVPDDLLKGPWLDELIGRASAGELALTGPGGFLPGLIKKVLGWLCQLEVARATRGRMLQVGAS